MKERGWCFSDQKKPELTKMVLVGGMDVMLDQF
jgi:hypothetical protein